MVFGRGDLSSVLGGTGSSGSLAPLVELEEGLSILSCSRGFLPFLSLESSVAAHSVDAVEEWSLGIWANTLCENEEMYLGDVFDSHVLRSRLLILDF